MKYIVNLTDKETGKVIESIEEVDDDIFSNRKEAAQTIEYLWEGGNMSCDCNRATYFGFENYKCGGGRFEAELTT